MQRQEVLLKYRIEDSGLILDQLNPSTVKSQEPLQRNKVIQVAKIDMVRRKEHVNIDEEIKTQRVETDTS